MINTRTIKLLLSGFVLAFAVQIVSPILGTLPSVYATRSIADDAKAYLYMSSVRKCLYSEDRPGFQAIKRGRSLAEINNGEWFQKGAPVQRPIVHESQGALDDCSNSSVVTGAADFFGYSDAYEMFIDLGGEAADGGAKGDPGKMGDNAYGKLSAKYGKSIEMTNAAYYKHYHDIFMSACQAREVPQGTAGDAKPVKIAGDDGKTAVKYFTYSKDSFPTIIPTNDATGLAEESCDEIAKKVNDNADSYANAVARDPNKAGGVTRGGSNGNAEEGKSTCNVVGLGWIVCPAMNFLAELYDNLYDQISNRFLVIQDTLVTNKATQKAWENFRNLANILFVMAFLVIVYSQVSNMGISNYGIKKLLPRLIIAAVLVNLSFWLCALAVDMSNLLGYGVKEMFGFIGGNVTGTAGAGQVTTAGTGPAAKLVGGALVLTGGIVLVSLSIGVVFFGGLALILALLILILRQALVVILIVVSPLAFVSFLLPNTEKFFGRWWKMFFTLLILFPIISAVFGGARLVSTIMNETGGASGSSELQLIAVGVQALPLFVVPSLIIASLSAFGALGNKLSGMAGGMQRRAGASARKGFQKKAERSTLVQAYKTGQAARDAKATRRFGERAKNGNLMARAGAYASGGKAGLDELGRRGEVLAEKEFNEDKAAYAAGWGEADFDNVKKIATGEVAAKSDAERTAAIERVMQKGSLEEKLRVVGSAKQTIQNGQSHALSAINAGVDSNGLKGLLGSDIQNQVRNGNVSGFDSENSDGTSSIYQRIAQNAENGGINAGTLTSSDSSAGITRAVVEKNMVSGTGIKNLQQATAAARKDPTRNIGEKMQGHFAAIDSARIPGGSSPAPSRQTGGSEKSAPAAPKQGGSVTPPSSAGTRPPVTPAAGNGTPPSAFGSGTTAPTPPTAGKPVDAPNERWTK